MEWVLNISGDRTIIDNEVKSHQAAEIQTEQVGAGTTTLARRGGAAGAAIGRDVDICAQCFIENDVVIGDRVTVKSGGYLRDGVRLDDDVFVGPHVTFTNDKPRLKQYCATVPVNHMASGATIGGGAVVLPGLVIGRGASDYAEFHTLTSASGAH